MPFQNPRSRRHFTPAAQAAAIEARRKKRELALPLDTPELFVVRLGDSSFSFGWELRRFGAVVLDRSAVGYLSAEEARSAGLGTLSDAGPSA